MTPDDINQFFSFLYEGGLETVTGWLRLAAGVIVSAIVAAMAVIMVKFRELMRPPPPAPEPPAAAGPPAPWQEVMARIESANPADWNLAVIRADAILDGVLKERFAGVTLGDRLKQLDRARFSSLDGTWEAHKLRNRIAHDTDRVLTYQEARRAVMLFGEALRELGYLKE